MQASKRRLPLIGLFIAMSVVGSLIKIPSPTGTIALDALPGFIAAGLLGGGTGALVGALGHLMTAFTAGFPLGPPLHLFIALEMALVLWTYAFLRKRLRRSMAILLAILANGVLSPLAFVLIPGFGIGFFLAMVLPLTIGSAVNILLADLVSERLNDRKGRFHYADE
jgi:uncharacterized membrane protein